MFDHNAMQELKHVKANAYQRAGGGGTHKVYLTAAAFDKAHGYYELSKAEQVEYRERVEFISAAENLLFELAGRSNSHLENIREQERKEAARHGVEFDGTIPF